MINRRKIEVYLITGFLGAGKTTLIKNMIQAFDLFTIGVLINEFGEIGVDSKLFSLNEIVIEISGGSIFCQCRREDFLQALFRFSTLSIDKLLIETSGLSDPTPFLSDLSIVQNQAKDPYEYKGCICVVDTSRFKGMSSALEIVNRQVLTSNVVVLNKIDLATKLNVKAVKKLIYRINTSLFLYETTYSGINLDLLTYLENNSTPVVERDSSNRPRSKSHLDITLNSKIPLNRKILISFLRQISPLTRRIKGFVQLNDMKIYHLDCIEDEIKIEERSEIYTQPYIIIIFNEALIQDQIDSVFELWDKVTSSK